MRSILDELTVAVQRKLAEGKHPFRYDLGNPNGDIPAEVVARMQKEAQYPENWRYMPAPGLPEAMQAACKRVSRRNDLATSLDWEQHVLVTRGTKTIIPQWLRVNLQPGDWAIAPDPCYAIIQDGVGLAYGNLETYRVGPNMNLIQEIRDACDRAEKSPKALILNFPHNPTGVVVDRDFYAEVVDLALEKKLKVLSDLAYADLVMSGEPAASILEVPKAMKCAVETRSMSKTYNIAGQVGFLFGNCEMVKKLTLHLTNFGYGVSAIYQMVAATALNDCEYFVRENLDVYRGRAKRMVESLRKIGWPMPEVLATIYAWGPLPPGFSDAEVFCRQLLEQQNVAVWPESGFALRPGNYVRFSLVEPRIEQAVEAIGRFIGSASEVYEISSLLQLGVIPVRT